MSENLPEERDEAARREEPAVVSASFSMMYSGTVPHPAIVEGYERFVPGAAERFLRMAELEQKSRIDADKDEAKLWRMREESLRIEEKRWPYKTGQGNKL